MKYFFTFSLFLILSYGCTKNPKEIRKEKSFDLARLEKIAKVQRELIERGQIGSNQVIIYKDGQVIYDSIVNSGLKGDANITSSTIFPLWSMSKPITTVAAMILFENGKFLMDDPLNKYLPEMANLKCLDSNGNNYPCKKSVTIFDVLTHQSGWDYYPTEVGEKYILISDTLYKNLEDFSKKMATMPLKFEPGTQYLYGINTSVLGRLIEVISGQTLYEFMKDNIFDPLEMTNTKFYLTDKERDLLQPLCFSEENHPVFYKHEYDDSYVQLGGAGLVSTSKDYSHFCEMLLNDGIFNDKRILSPASIKYMREPINTELNEGTFIGFSTGFSFFNLTNPNRDGALSPKGIFGWGGYHATLFWIDQENDLYGLVMDRGSYSAREMFRKIRIATYQALK
jgi:CubicO group peptidase (beta-lactamase class C family)